MPLVINTSCHLQESPVCVSSPSHWPNINLSDSHVKDFRAATKLGWGLEGCVLIPSYFYSRNAFYCLASIKLFFFTLLLLGHVAATLTDVLGWIQLRKYCWHYLFLVKSVSFTFTFLCWILTYQMFLSLKHLGVKNSYWIPQYTINTKSDSCTQPIVTTATTKKTHLEVLSVITTITSYTLRIQSVL